MRRYFAYATAVAVADAFRMRLHYLLYLFLLLPHSHSYLLCLFCCDLCNILGKLSNWYKKHNRTNDRPTEADEAQQTQHWLPPIPYPSLSLSPSASISQSLSQSTRFEFLQFRCVLSLHSFLIPYSGYIDFEQPCDTPKIGQLQPYKTINTSTNDLDYFFALIK